VSGTIEDHTEATEVCTWAERRDG